MRRLGDVHIRIGATITALRDKLTKAKGLVGKFARGVSNIMSVITGPIGQLAAGIGALSAALVTAAKSFADYAIKLDSQAKLLNMTTVEYQRLAKASELAGVGQEQFFDSVRQMTKNIGEALQGNKTYIQAFRDLGITLDDLRSKSPSEIFDQIAQALPAIGTQAERNAAMFRMFGESGQQLGAVLLSNADTYRKYLDVASGSGSVTEETVQQSKALSFEVAKLQGEWDNLTNWIMSNLLPLATDIVGFFNSVAGGIRETIQATKEMIGLKVDTVLPDPDKMRSDSQAIQDNIRALTDELTHSETKANELREAIKRLSDLNIDTTYAEQLLAEEIQRQEEIRSKLSEIKQVKQEIADTPIVSQSDIDKTRKLAESIIQSARTRLEIEQDYLRQLEEAHKRTNDKIYQQAIEIQKQKIQKIKELEAEKERKKELKETGDVLSEMNQEDQSHKTYNTKKSKNKPVTDLQPLDQYSQIVESKMTQLFDRIRQSGKVAVNDMIKDLIIELAKLESRKWVIKFAKESDWFTSGGVKNQKQQVDVNIQVATDESAIIKNIDVSGAAVNAIANNIASGGIVGQLIRGVL